MKQIRSFLASALLLLAAGPALAAAEPPPVAETRMITSNGHRVAFHVTPGKQPAIVLDAGGGNDSTYWSKLAPELAKRTGAQVITYDRAGFGTSDEVPGPWSPLAATDDLENGLRELGATRGVVLVSHSVAGQLATYLTQRHPDWFAGVVLVDASVPDFYTDAAVTRTQALYEPMIAQLQAAPPSQPGRQLLALAQSFVETSRAFHQTRWPDAVPAVVIVAEKTPFEQPEAAKDWHAAQAKFAAAAKNRRLVIATKSSHDVAKDRPELIIKAVLELRRQRAAEATAPAKYDVVIRNGRILDGAGNPWIRADVAIANGRLVKIGTVAGRGKREIDAAGKYVSPGWIDVMDQSDEALLVDGTAENKLRDGVTTAIAGEGGAPVGSAKLDGYFAQLQRQGISLNFGIYYGATQARVEVMGDIDGVPSAAQLDAERAHVDEAMRAGAMGIATALIYAPASYQQTDELVELAKVAHRHGGIYASHIRDEGEHLLEAIRESIRIGELSGADVEVFHLKGAYAPGWGKLMPEAGKLIGEARAKGISIAADMYPYTAGGTGLDITVPNWIWAEGKEKGIAKLADPANRARLKQEVATGSLPGWTNLIVAAGGWDRVVLVSPHVAEYEKFKFKDLVSIGKELGRDPVDVAWDIVVRGYPQRPTALFFGMSEGDIETALKFPWTSIGSDASAITKTQGGDGHPRGFGTFSRVIAEYVKARGVLTLEEAIRKMTSWPATRMKLFDRGTLREGLRADVTIFDYDTIKDRATYERPSEYPLGIDYVLVNGAVVIDQGRHTGAKPGMVLRGAGFQAAVR